MHTYLRSALILTGAVLAFAPVSANAAGFTVNSTADTTDATPGNGTCATAGAVCTLRAAIVEANALSGADEITVPAGTYATASALAVTKSVTINAPAGPRATIIDGAPGATVLDVNGADNATVRGLTLTGGTIGLVADATDLVVDQITIRGNAQTNVGISYGAGLAVRSTGVVVMTRSAITGNTATSTSSAAGGAGVFVEIGGQFTAEASTIAGNTVASPGLGQTSFGGGILTFGTVILRHVTLLNNAASGGSAGNSGNLYIQGGSASVSDTIISGGQASLGTLNCGPTKPVASGRNIDSGTTCGFGAGQLSSTDPQLESFGDYGGPTDTAPPKLASPAYNQSASCLTGGLDQRGAPAPTGPSCDIGAAELSTDVAVTLEASRASVASGADVTYLARVTNNGADAATGVTLDVTAAGADQVVVASASSGTCTTAVRCELGTVARGTTITTTIVVRAAAAGTLTATARVASTTPDPAAPNNETNTATTVTGDGSGDGSGDGPGGGPGGGPGSDSTAPRLGALKLSGKTRSGRTITLLASLSEAASVTLKIERLTNGRRSGKTCSTKAKKGKRCTTAKTLGTIKLAGTAGTPKLVLPAKIAKRKLAAGKYRITATATDTAGNRSAARTLTITVKR